MERDDHLNPIPATKIHSPAALLPQGGKGGNHSHLLEKETAAAQLKAICVTRYGYRVTCGTGQPWDEDVWCPAK